MRIPPRDLRFGIADEAIVRDRLTQTDLISKTCVCVEEVNDLTQTVALVRLREECGEVGRLVGIVASVRV